MSWTLEYGGTEQTLDAWGLGNDLVLERANQGVDRLRVTAPGACDGTALFAYGQEVIIRRDRTYSGGSWSGGTIYFRGKATGLQRIGSGSAEGVRYEFAGPWWDFERMVYQQEWRVYDPGSEEVVTGRISELFLGLDVDGNKLTTAEQVEEAVEWAVSCGVSCQVGTIDAGVEIPSYNVREITVAEVIRQMLRWTPDVVTWFDYTTSPPTFHARKLASLTSRTLTVGTDAITGFSLVPRYDLALPAVVLKFKKINEVNGAPYLQIEEQKYPVDATGTEVGALVATVELAGSRTQWLYASVVSAALAPEEVGWWQEREPWMADETIDPASLTVSDVTVVDEEGQPLDREAYPYELRSGQVASWMPGGTKRVTVTAWVSYDLYFPVRDENNEMVYVPELAAQRQRRKKVSMRLVATDLQTGTYSSLSEYDPGETVPSGLAQAIYDAHATLQHAGEIRVVGEEMTASIGMGCKVTLATGSATYENMIVQGTVEEPHAGRLTVRVGPAEHLGLSDLIELLRVNRYRLIYNAPESRTTGISGGAGAMELGRETPRENASGGGGEAWSLALRSVADDGTNLVMRMDADKGQLVAATIDDEGVVQEENASRWIMDLADLEGREAKFRWFRFLDKDDACKRKKMLILCTEPEDDLEDITD